MVFCCIIWYLCKYITVTMICRPLEASSVIQAVTALLNRLLQEVCSETLGRGQSRLCVNDLPQKQLETIMLNFVRCILFLIPSFCPIRWAVCSQTGSKHSAQLQGDYSGTITPASRAGQKHHRVCASVLTFLFAMNIPVKKLLVC